MKKINQKVFEKIQQEDVKMDPKSYFTLKSLAWIFLGGIIFIIAATLLGIVLGYVSALEPGILFFKEPIFFLFSLPVGLIALVLILIYLSSRAYRLSRSCCRHEDWFLLGFLFLGALIVGWSLADTQMDHYLGKNLSKNSFYGRTVATPKKFWSNPDKGTLSGRVLLGEGEQKEVYLIQSWDGEVWLVRERQEGAQWEEKVEMKQRAPVKFYGKKQNEDEFIFANVWKWD